MKTKLFENINGNKFKLVENGHGETDMNNPEEKREVQIVKEILKQIKDIHSYNTDKRILKSLNIMEQLLDELITMHGVTK